MGPLGFIFNLEAMKTIADMPSQEYAGEGFIKTMSNIGGTGPTSKFG